MFKLTLRDREGTLLNEGDIVAISDGRGLFTFYSEVKYLKDKKKIAPFHTFSFHSFLKIDKLPDNVEQSTNEEYKIWFPTNGNRDFAKEDLNYKDYEKYLMDWRECETLIEKSCYQITPLEE